MSAIFNSDREEEGMVASTDVIRQISLLDTPYPQDLLSAHHGAMKYILRVTSARHLLLRNCQIQEYLKWRPLQLTALAEWPMVSTAIRSTH